MASFHLIPALASIPIEQAASQSANRDGVVCVDALDDMLYVATLHGAVCSYHFNREDATTVLVHRKRTISAQQHITALVVLPESQCIAVLADTLVVFYDLAMQPVSALRPIKTITAMAADTAARSEPVVAKGVDRLILARRRSIVIVQLHRAAGATITMTELKEIPFPDGVARFAWYNRYIAAADLFGRYRCITLPNTLKIASSNAPAAPLQPAEPRIVGLAAIDLANALGVPGPSGAESLRPHILVVSAREYLVVCRLPPPTSSRAAVAASRRRSSTPGGVGAVDAGLLASAVQAGAVAIGVFVNPRGERVTGRPALSWSNYPKAVALHFPFVVALVPDPNEGPMHLTSHSLLSGTSNLLLQPHQNDPIPIAAFGLSQLPQPMTSTALGGQLQLFARERDALYALACPTYASQIGDLIRRGECTAAVTLARGALAADAARNVQLRVVLEHIRRCEWEDALQRACEAKFPTRWLVALVDPARVVVTDDSSQQEPPATVTDAMVAAVALDPADAESLPTSLGRVIDIALHKLTGGQANADPATVASLRVAVQDACDRFVLAYLESADPGARGSVADIAAAELLRIGLQVRTGADAREVVAQARRVAAALGDMLSSSTSDTTSLPSPIQAAAEAAADQLARSRHAFAASLIHERLGRVRDVLDAWKQICDDALAFAVVGGRRASASGGKALPTTAVGTRDIAALLLGIPPSADRVADFGGDVHWLLARDRRAALDVVRMWAEDAPVLSSSADDTALAIATELGDTVALAFLEDDMDHVDHDDVAARAVALARVYLRIAIACTHEAGMPPLVAVYRQQIASASGPHEPFATMLARQAIPITASGTAKSTEQAREALALVRCKLFLLVCSVSALLPRLTTTDPAVALLGSKFPLLLLKIRNLLDPAELDLLRSMLAAEVMPLMDDAEYPMERILLADADLEKGTATMAIRRIVQKVGDFGTAQAICAAAGLAFDLIVTEYMALPNRDALTPYFLSIATANLAGLDFDALVAVLPAGWPVAHAASLLEHQLARATRSMRWSGMVKALERTRTLTTRLDMASRKLQLSSAGPAVELPAQCQTCALVINAAEDAVAVDPSGRVSHVVCRR
ncbi:hypothetical protein BC828DRAFT_377540 [Blastocladiella britannica]|nr:hypothetical protein BC828DRAFT_377540 [Blastocladiella britannica]